VRFVIRITFSLPLLRTKNENMATLEWKVNTPQLLKEILQNNNMVVLNQPLQIFANILGEVATRASQLNDPELNALMARLALYEVTDPYSKEFDAKITDSLIKKGMKAK
jgi:hypothetical protein